MPSTRTPATPAFFMMPNLSSLETTACDSRSERVEQFAYVKRGRKRFRAGCAQRRHEPRGGLPVARDALRHLRTQSAYQFHEQGWIRSEPGSARVSIESGAVDHQRTQCAHQDDQLCFEAILCRAMHPLRTRRWPAGRFRSARERFGTDSSSRAARHRRSARDHEQSFATACRTPYSDHRRLAWAAASK
jgi:hypothetical protein